MGNWCVLIVTRNTKMQVKPALQVVLTVVGDPPSKPILADDPTTACVDDDRRETFTHTRSLG